MKKIVALLLMLLSVMSLSAQRNIVLDRNFNVSGKLAAFCEKADPQPDDIMLVEDGYSWHLKNTAISESNYVEFWISKDFDDQRLYYSSWSKDIKVVLLRNDDGKVKGYIVADGEFIHLTISINGKGYATAHLCSVLME